MNTIQGKREFLSKILYDDQAWTLLDEAIIAGYCAYFRVPKSLEDAWIKYKDVEPPKERIVFLSPEEFDIEDGEEVPECVQDEYNGLVQRIVSTSRAIDKLKFEEGQRDKVDSANYLCYVFYDSSNTILYVGKTNSFITRWSDHVKNKDTSRIERIEFHTFDSHPEVLFYETQLIIENQPEWNKRDTGGKKASFNLQPLEVLHAAVLP
jgi:hypothetical protein